MHLKSTLITHRVLIRGWFLMTALGLSPPSSHHRAQADHHVAQSKALDSLPMSRNNHSHASAPQDTGINSAALRLSTALRLNGFSARTCISLWKFLGQCPPGHCESPGEGERKEKTSPRQILPCLCSKILDSSAVSQALQLSLHLTFFISLQLSNYADDSSWRGFASHSQTSTLLWGVYFSTEGIASSWIIGLVKLDVTVLGKTDKP